MDKEILLFREVLTNLVESKKYVVIDYKTEIGELLHKTAIITRIDKDNIYPNIGDGIAISLLVRVDDELAPGVGDNYFMCDC